MKRDLAVFIPAYQAEATLSEVLARIPAELWERIIQVNIVDDGSRDNTSRIIAALGGRYPRVVGVRFPQNRGYGHAVREGLRLSIACGAEYAACLHADGQYPPEKLPWFLAIMEESGIDLLQGSRHKEGGALRGGMPLYKLVAGKVLTALENLCFGLNLSDYHSGYLVYGPRALRRLDFAALSPYFDFDLEVIASARAHGLCIGEEAIPTRYAGEVSHLRPVRYGLRVLRVLWKYLRGDFDPKPSANITGE